ncbi:MAG: 50S ribosomal protein L25 [Terriglobia bacterium]
MALSNVSAEVRSTRGKNAARQLRQRGLVPAVLYGEQKGSIALSVNPKQLSAILHSARGYNTIFTVDLKDGESTSVMLKEWQLDPVSGSLLHADLLRIAMDKLIQVRIPVTAVGEAKGVKVQGGIFEFVLREIEVECLPADIPETITIEITELELGANVRVSDLPKDSKYKILSEPELVVAHVVSPKEEKVEEVVAAEAPAEPEVIKKGKVATEEEGEEEKPEEKKK